MHQKSAALGRILSHSQPLMASPRRLFSRLLLTVSILLLAAPAARSGGQPAASAKTATLAFFLDGVECGACAYQVQAAVAEVKGVSAVDVVQQIDSYANITFDPAAVSAHQIAQAVREACPLHGRPYLASLYFRAPGCAGPGGEAKAAAAFSRFKSLVKIELADEKKHEFAISFEPIGKDESKKGPQGWRHESLAEALKSASPAGLAAGFAFVTEGQERLAPPSAKQAAGQ